MSDPRPEPGWDRLLAAARRLIERSGGSLAGTVSLSDPTDDERRLVIGITGVHRAAGTARLAVRLTAIDDYLRGATGGGLVELLAATAPVRDRPGEARAAEAARQRLRQRAGERGLDRAEWFDGWWEGLRRDGTLTRAARDDRAFLDAVAVLSELPAADEPLPAFAERVLGDTKALGGPARGLVLRALALWFGLDTGGGAEGDRRLWEAAGVIPDDLASQVLVLGVAASGGPVADWLTQAARERIPYRLTLHQLRTAPLVIRSDEIFVCENPAVLRAAVGLPHARPLVCTEGVPSGAVHALLASAGDATIRWRNDFDWTGVRVTSAALRRYPRARPWRMAAEDYLPRAASGPALVGAAAQTPWDPSLAAAMHAHRRLVTEERLLDVLLGDLTA